MPAKPERRKPSGFFMGKSAPRPCTYPGCGTLSAGSRCARHKHTEKRQHDAKRGGANERGYNYRWQKESKYFLRLHPLCQCEACDEGRIRVRAASVVDHKVPHRGDPVLFWNQTNWQSMAKECHDKKTARHDGGFGGGVGAG